MNSLDDFYTHFGIKFDEEITPRYMTKDNFVDKEADVNKYLTPLAIENALKNYDANMEYFNSLNKEEFEKALDDVLGLYVFMEIDDVNVLKGKQGIYILILDDYKQLYIGQSSDDLKKRIVRHLRIKIPYKRVPYIRYDTLPIDAFKPLDITRIYALFSSSQKDIDNIEAKLIENTPSKFVLNKMVGGKCDSYTDLFMKGLFGSIKKDVKGGSHINEGK